MNKKSIVIILLIALVLRILWGAIIHVDPVSDSEMYHMFAVNLTNGDGYSYPDGRLTAYWPVGTSAIYSLLYRVFGISYLPIVVMNIIIGTIIVFLTFRIAEREFNNKVATISASIVACWPVMIQFTTILASELIYICLVLLSIDLWSNKKIKIVPRLIFWSIVVCITTYIRTTLLPILLIYPILKLLKERNIKLFLLSVSISIISIVIIFSPWVYRNYKVFNDFILVATNSGTNLWMGNNPESDGKYMEIPTFPDLNEHERDVLLSREAKNYILSNPLEYVKLSMKRFFSSYKAETIGIVWNSTYLSKILHSITIKYLKILSSLYWLAIAFLSLFGIIIYLKKDINNIINPLFITTIYIFIIPILTVGQDRYHLPVDTFLSIFAAVAIIEIFTKVYLKFRNNYSRNNP